MEDIIFGVPKKSVKEPLPKICEPLKKVNAEYNKVKEEKKENNANRVKDFVVYVNEEEVVEVDRTR